MCFCQPTSWKVVKLSISYPVIHVNDDKITCLKTKFKLSSKNIEIFKKNIVNFWYIRTVQNGSGVSVSDTSERFRTVQASPNYPELFRTNPNSGLRYIRTVQAYQVFALDSKLKSGQFLQHNKLKMHDL